MSHIYVERRERPRLRLQIAADFTSYDGRQTILLDDLSHEGAHVTLSRAEPLSQGLLRWLGFEVFAEVVWREGEECGLRFDEALPAGTILRTREQAPGLHTDKAGELRKVAEEWVQGTRS